MGNRRRNARFRIKVLPFGGVALKDTMAPAFVRSYSSLEAACFAMDNRVRREMGLPDRPQITRREIRDAMRTAQDGLLASTLRAYDR